MRFAAVLNRDGGTLRTLDLDGFRDRMRDLLEAAGHSIDIDVVAGKDIVPALDNAASRRGIDVVLAGGGDGTISAAAARLMGKKKALAILPAGTMNLFARARHPADARCGFAILRRWRGDGGGHRHRQWPAFRASVLDRHARQDGAATPE
ncbi:hypothetical protein LB579_07165, partial [Mesorhizobium sp. BR1-1-7]|uniref:diacylglycerol/lipid kinase family protein n=1 Tax=Mesorhizobium sp. BR1-1-7 TaxID=2876647 RepID=UPI0021E1E861